MACEFKLDDGKSFPGTTLFTKPAPKPIRPTAVYVAPGHQDKDTALDVVLWLHGWNVDNERHLMHADRAQVRASVRDAGKDVVLIAPYLGTTRYDPVVGGGVGNFSTGDLGGAGWGERYLDEVLAGLDAFRGVAARTHTIRKLVIACHSGGGAGMRGIVGTLGAHRGKLAECWGLDCLYGQKVEPDDATFWHRAMLGADAVPLHFYYAKSTIPQSVKLDLMARGMADDGGELVAERLHPPMQNLHVTFAQPVPGGDILKVMVPVPYVPKRQRRGSRPDGDFVKAAAANVAKIAEAPDIHYVIARDRLLERLKATSAF